MKNNKGFTLIELLVVVAIIGTLAAVGVVAYNGYTEAARKNSSKAIHANVVKYISSELAKCGLGNVDELFGVDQSGESPTVSCDTQPGDIIDYLTGADTPLQDKNPHSSSGEDAVTEASAADATLTKGFTTLFGTDDSGEGATGGTILVRTNYGGTEPLENTIDKD